MIELGLQRISRLLSATALPWRAIHVAGTNGKGTVCNLTSAMLNAYNLSRYRESRSQPRIKHARFTSPHLVDRWDCITFDDPTSKGMRSVPEDEFLECEDDVKNFNNEHNINATEFELLTATAFRLFSEKEIDIAVVEVGLGGRLDATNVIGEPVSGSTETKLIRRRFNPAKWRPSPLITAITQIGLDHQNLLGNTREEIAQQKAGIMKSGAPVTWAPDSELESLFIARAKDLNAPVVKYEQLPITHKTLDGSTGRRVNGKLAIASTWTALSALGRLPHSEDAAKPDTPLISLVSQWHDIVEGFVFSGRQETILLEPITEQPIKALLDGAHNEDGIRELAETVNSKLRCDGKPIIWVVGISDSADRQPEKMLRQLLQQKDRIIAVEFGPVDGMPWVTPKPADLIIEAAQSVVPGIDAKALGSDVKAALQTAAHLADPSGAHVVVCGSLYLAGDVHRLLRDAKEKSEAESESA